MSAEREGDFGPARQEDDRRLAAGGVGEHVAAEPQPVRWGVLRTVDHRDLLTRQHQRDGAVSGQDRHTPCFHRFGRVRRSDDDQVGDRPQCGELLDRLMRGTVLPEADRVVREDVDHRQVGQRSEADRRPHVIRKNEERRADRPDAAVQGESVQDRAHPMLAHAEMDIARAPAPGRHVAPVLEGEVRRGREVRRPADELGEPGREGVQHLPRRRARGLGIGGGGGGGGGGRERRETVVPAVRQTAGEPALELRGELRECLPIRFVLLRPLGFEAGAALPGEPPVRERFVRHVERLEAGPAEALLGELHLFLAEWGAVGLGRVLLVRAAVRDVRAHDDQRRPVRDAPGGGERRIECAEVVAVRHALHVPAVALEPLRRVVREREIGLAVDGDAVVVVDPDQTAELQMAGERAGLVRHALHQVPVGREEIRTMVHDAVTRPVEQLREVRLRERHPHGVPHPLTERAGRGLDARGEPVLGVARRAAPPLAELLDVVEREVVPGEVEGRVEQHAGMSGRQYEAVAPEPVGVRGIVSQMPLPQHVGDGGEGHRGPGVAGIGPLDRVHREGADGVDAKLIE